MLQSKFLLSHIGDRNGCCVCWNDVGAHTWTHVNESCGSRSSCCIRKAHGPSPCLYAYSYSTRYNFLKYHILVMHESCYNAAKIISVVKRHHLVLCTLLISNATAMEVYHIAPEIITKFIHISILKQVLFIVSGASYILEQIGPGIRCHYYFSDFNTSLWRGQDSYLVF